MAQHLVLCLFLSFVIAASASNAVPGSLPGIWSSEWSACPSQDEGGFSINLAAGQRFGCCMEAPDWLSQLDVHYWSLYNSTYAINVYRGVVCGRGDNYEYGSGYYSTGQPEPELICRSEWVGDHHERHRTYQVMKGPQRPSEAWYVTWEVQCGDTWPLETPLDQCTINVDYMDMLAGAPVNDDDRSPSC